MSYLLLCLALLLFPPPVFAFGHSPALSFQGYTGLLNIPDAEVTPEGTMEFLFSDQIEPEWRDRVPRQENYQFSIGVLPHVEGGVRLIEADRQARDLSANIKVRVPLPEAWPRLAFGIQDIAGGAPHVRTAYAVLSHDVSRLRLVAGYGIGPDRLDGFFGGVNLRVTHWLHLMAEHDTDEAAGGFRLLTPDGFLPWRTRLAATARTSLEKDVGDLDFAASLRFPLGRDVRAPLPRSEPPSSPDQTAHFQRDLQGGGSANDFPAAELAEIRRLLAAHGFENIRIGVEGRDILYVEFENSLYNHNELDGLGVALGTVLEAAPDDFVYFRLRLKNENLPVFEMSGLTGLWRDFFRHPEDETPTVVTLLCLRENLRAGNPPTARPSALRLLPGTANPKRFRPTLMLHPGLDTAVGTDFGVLDYRLSLKADLFLPLWAGAVANVRGDFPLAWSDDYGEGGALDTRGTDPALERVFLNQAFRPTPAVTTLFGGGMYLKDVYGVLNETVWTPDPGVHRLRMRVGRFDPEGEGGRTVVLGSYRLYFSPLDLFIEGTAGRFFGGDDGYQIELRRFFGDTAVSAVYTRTDEHIAAFRISFPLTPRRDMKPRGFQVRGADRFAYELNTVLARKGGRNPLVFGLGAVPQTAVNLERTFYNTDRLNENYLRAHLLRLLEAYRKYGAKD